MDEALQESPATKGRRIEAAPTATEIPPRVHAKLVEFIKDRFNLQQASEHVEALSSPEFLVVSLAVGAMNVIFQWGLSEETCRALVVAIATSNTTPLDFDAALIDGYTLF